MHTKGTMSKTEVKKTKTTFDQNRELKVKKPEVELKREQFRTFALNTMIDIAGRKCCLLFCSSIRF